MEKKKDRFATLKWAFITVLMIAPAIICLLFIRAYGVNVPFWDEWENVRLFDKLYAGQLSFADLFAQHNEHRIFFPRLVTLTLGYITHYNNLAEMYFSWFLLCLISYVIFRIYTRSFGTSQGALAKFIPVVWLIFSLRQWENLLMGMCFCGFMMVLFFVVAIYLLDTSRNVGWRFILSITCAIICTFSYSNGLLVWPIGLLLILIKWWPKIKDAKTLVVKTSSLWCLIGILVYTAYFIGYTKPSYHPDVLYFLSNPVSATIYLLAAIGSPFAAHIDSAIGVGILILALYIFIGVYFIINKFKTRPHMFFPFALILFAVLTSITLVVARSGFGIEQALSSRYTSFTMLGVIGLYLFLIETNFKSENIKPFLSGFMISIILFGLIATDINAIECGRAIKSERDSIAYILTTVEFQSDEQLKRLYPNAQIVRERAEILKKYQLNVFASPYSESPKRLTLMVGTTLFYIDTINGHQPAQQGFHIIIDSQQQKDITISGWAVDQKAGQAAGGVFINVDGQKDIPAIYGLDRPDVAAVYKNDLYRFSGFSASFAASLLDNGQHTLSLKIVTADEKGYYVSEQVINLYIK